MANTRIALISMPWQDPFSPSIQLGTLSAWVRHKRPDVKIDTFEYYLDLADAIGLHLAKRISETWIGESLFAYILFPQQTKKIATFLENSKKTDPIFGEVDFGVLIENLRTRLFQRLQETDWSCYTLVGVSVVFSQMMGSILVAHEIKKRAPMTRIVFGGPSCTNLIGKSLLNTFPFVDYIVNGEGEKPLLNLIAAIEDNPHARRITVPAVVHSGSSDTDFGIIDQMDKMTELPAPEYDGYFRTIEQLGASVETLGRVRLPIETSRGCWWDRSAVDPMLSCAFCNLNLQWRGYREKSVKQSLLDIEHLARRYQCPDFTVVDNILRHRNLDEFIEGMKRFGGGFDFWMEARASVKPDQIRGLREGGGRVIQFGIEALSTSVLKKIVKGTTAIQNLQAMKFCEQYGVNNTANLIIYHPGLNEEDIRESLANIEFARGFKPLNIAEFSLMYQSPAYKAPDRFGISAVDNCHMYSMLFPDKFLSKLFLTEKSFECPELDRLRPMWDAVRDAVANWRQHYEQLSHVVEGGLLLSIQDGIDYLKIRDFRYESPRFYWLRGAERDVYLECDQIIAINDIYNRFPMLGKDKIDELYERWLDQKLVFVEKKQVLALAVPWGAISSKRTLQISKVAEQQTITSFPNRGAD